MSTQETKEESRRRVSSKAARDDSAKKKARKKKAATPVAAKKKRVVKGPAKKTAGKPHVARKEVIEARGLQRAIAPPIGDTKRTGARDVSELSIRMLKEIFSAAAAKATGAVSMSSLELPEPRWKSLLGGVLDTAPEVLSATTNAVKARRVPVLSFTAGLQQIVESHSALSSRVEDLVNAVTFTVAPKTRSGQPIQQFRGQISELSDSDFDGIRPDDKACDVAERRLLDLGFQILRRGRFGITARGPAELVADVLGAPLQVMAQPSTRRPRSMAATSVSDAGITPTPSQMYLAPSRSLSLRSRVSESIDNFVFSTPPIYFGRPSAEPPAVSWHNVEKVDIRRLFGVGEGSPSGKGVRTALIDSGFYPHPYFDPYTIHRVRIATSTDPAVDDEGHGTAILYNLLAVAPETEVIALAQSNPVQDSIEAAFYEQGAQILSCSWGYDNEASLTFTEAMIRDVVKDGCVVLFASGNGQYAWPGSMPEVLSIGGVYADKDDALQASNYASGFMSSLYLNRRVPDVCGLCGQIPKGVYILMPTQPGSKMDIDQGGGPYEEFDETTWDDGWCGASGTSSAAPQVAGVVALLLEASLAAGNTLTPTLIREVLEQSARPVEAGRNAFGFPARGTPNTATGWGLVNFERALTLLRSKGLA